MDEPGTVEPVDEPGPVATVSSGEHVLERDLKLAPQPFFSVRRLVIAVLLVAAVALLVIGFGGTDGSGGDQRDAAVVALFPGEGDRVLSQSQVGAELQAGYDGRLTINGVAIPEEQMEGALSPEAESQLSSEERGRGVRPNNKNSVKFKPGPSKALARLDTGAVELVVRYWRVEDGEDNARRFSWTIYVT